jgi:hypothetical protein
MSINVVNELERLIAIFQELRASALNEAEFCREFWKNDEARVESDVKACVAAAAAYGNSSVLVEEVIRRERRERR